MKVRILSLLLTTLLTTCFFAQAVPQKINYQAIARDANGEVLANQSLNITVAILSGSAYR